MKRYGIGSEDPYCGLDIEESEKGEYCLASEVDTEIDLLKKKLEHAKLDYMQVLGSVGLLHEELKYAEEEIRDKDEQITKMCEQAIAYQNEIQRLRNELYSARKGK